MARSESAQILGVPPPPSSAQNLSASPGQTNALGLLTAGQVSAAPSSPTVSTTYDAKVASARAQIANFYNWGQANKVKLWLGELNVPTNNPALGYDVNYDPRWTILLDRLLVDIDNYGMGFTGWAASSALLQNRFYSGTTSGSTATASGIDLSVVSDEGKVLERHLASSAIRGVNLSGAEYGYNAPNGGLFLGIPNNGYFYHSAASWAFLASRGVKWVRFPIRWERIQPTLKGALSTTELALLLQQLEYAAANGVKVIVDIHNFAQYDTAALGNTTHSAAGLLDLGANAPSGLGTMASCFVDLWTKLTTALTGKPGLGGLDLMNEPQNITGGVSVWQSASAAAVEAIRAVDSTVLIAVEGYNFSSAGGFSATNGSAWLTGTIPGGQPNAGQLRNTDPNLVFEAHQYVGTGNNSDYSTNTYSQLLTTADVSYDAFTETINQYAFDAGAGLHLQSLQAPGNPASGAMAYSTGNGLRVRAGVSGPEQRIKQSIEDVHGFIALSADPQTAFGNTAPTAGVLYAAKVYVPETCTPTILELLISGTAGSSLSNCFMGLYSSTGSRLAVTSDQSSAWQSVGDKACAIVTPVQIDPGYYYVVFLVGAGTPCPLIANSTQSGTQNFGLTTGAQYRFGSVGTAQTALPASFSPASLGNARAWLLGLR